MTEEQENKDPFAGGTVIRWLAMGKYEFAALRADNGFWYLTGGAGMYGTSMKTFNDLLGILDEPENEITKLQVATEWEDV